MSKYESEEFLLMESGFIFYLFITTHPQSTEVLQLGY